MKIMNRSILFFALLLFAGYTAMAQQTVSTENSKTNKSIEMKTYVIEREIPAAGKLTADQLKGIAQTSCKVITEMGPRIQWLQSYVTADKIYCIYKAESIELIKEHAKKGGFPANKIVEVASVFSPATAEN